MGPPSRSLSSGEEPGPEAPLDPKAGRLVDALEPEAA